ncbi:hypothetical protein KP509_14G077400 [Ceratopteris richardii]|nr:hypothetical protein KP509_14G077400 [Ceratopteris richardii]
MGYNDTSKVLNSGRSCNGNEIRPPHLSPSEVGVLPSPRLDRNPYFVSHSNGAHTPNRGTALEERDRLQLSRVPVLSELPHKCKERMWGRPDYHRRTYPLPKLESPRGWGSQNEDLLEGRVDRYRNALNRDSAPTDNLNSSREHNHYEWRSRDRTLLTGMPSRSPTMTSPNNSYLKDFASASSLEDTRPISPLGQIGSLKNSPAVSNHNADEGSSSPKKRPRLTWGQGLAKYEKEKIAEGHSTCNKGDEREAASPESLIALSDCQKNPTENAGTVFPCNNQYALVRSPDSGGLKNGCEIERSSLSQDIAACPSDGSLSKAHSENENEGMTANISTVKGPSLDTALLPSSVLQEAEVLLSNLSRKGLSTLSKDVLIQLVEKVEQEAIQLEKELNKVNDDQERGISSSCDGDNMKMEVQKDEYLQTKLYTAEDHQKHGDDYSTPPIVDTEKPLTVHNCDTCSPQICENPELDSTLEATEKSKSSSDLCDAMPGVVLNTEISDGVQFSDGNVKPDLEISSGVKMGLVESILMSNQSLAEQSKAFLAHLGSSSAATSGSVRVGDIPDQSGIWRYDAGSCIRNRKHLQAKVLEAKASRIFLEKVMALKYQAQRKAWCCRKKESLSDVEGQQSDDIKLHSTSDSTVLDSKNKQDAQSVEMQKIIFHVGQKREFLRMPPMHLGIKQGGVQRCEMKNGLVDDPVSAEKERKSFNPWSSEEKRVFLERFSLLGKNFRGIAAYLEHKTVADCVEYYYRNQKLKEFEEVQQRRRQEKEQRYKTEKYMLQQSVYCPYMEASQYSQKPESWEGLSLVAAVAEAMSAPAEPASEGLGTRSYKMVASEYSEKVTKKSDSKVIQVPSPGRKALRSEWNDAEREAFTNALVLFGKDFKRISQYVGTKSVRQCRSFFSKSRRCLGLDELVERYKFIRQGSRVKSLGSEPSSHIVDTEAGTIGEVDYPQQQCTGPHFSVIDPRTAASGESFHENESIYVKEHNLREQSEAICSKVSPSPVANVHNSISQFKESNLKLQSEIVGEDVCPSPNVSLYVSEQHMTDDQVKQEACLHSDSGEKSSGDLSTSVRLPSQVPSMDGRKRCRNPNSSVSVEMLHCKGEPVSVKAEVACAVDSSDKPFATKSRETAPLSGTKTVSNSVSAATVIESPLMREATQRVQEIKTRKEPTSWTQEERQKFVEVLRLHGKNWERLCECLPGKSLTQIKTYFQNSKGKLGFIPEGNVNSNGRVGAPKKRRVDDSDSSNLCCGTAAEQRKVPVQSEYKILPSLLATSAGMSSQPLSPEFMYANVLHRNMIEDTQKTLKSKGLNVTQTTASSLFNPALFTANLSASEQYFGHQNQNTVVLPPLQQSSSSLVLMKPAQEQIGSLTTSVHQGYQSQPSQPLPWAAQDLIFPVAEQYQKQLETRDLEASQTTSVHQHHQHHQQAVQQSKQQADDVGLQHVPCHFLQRQQMQIFSRQASDNYLHQISPQQKANSSQQTPSQVVSLQQHRLSHLKQNASTHLAPGNQSSKNDQLAFEDQISNEQLQLQVEGLNSQPFQTHIVVSPLPRQQQQIQPPQFQQIYWEHQQTQPKKSSRKESYSQVSSGSTGNISLLGEQPSLSKGISQSSDHHTEVLEQSDSMNSKQSNLQRTAGGSLTCHASSMQWPQLSTKPKVASEGQLHSSDVKLFGQSLLAQPVSNGQQQQSGQTSDSLPQSVFPSGGTSISNQQTADVPHQAVDSLNSGWPQSATAISDSVAGPSHKYMGSVNSNGQPEVSSVQEAVARVNEKLMRSAYPTGDSLTHVSPAIPAAPFMHHITDKSVCGMFSDPIQQSRGFQRSDYDRNLTQGSQISRNIQHLQDFRATSLAPLEVPQGLPRVLDALAALAEWRIKNADGGGGKLMDEFLSQSWEALQRDPSSLVEAGKVVGSLAQLYAGNAEVFQHLKDGFTPTMHLFAGPK